MVVHGNDTDKLPTTRNVLSVYTTDFINFLILSKLAIEI